MLMRIHIILGIVMPRFGMLWWYNVIQPPLQATLASRMASDHAFHSMSSEVVVGRGFEEFKNSGRWSRWAI